jgi:hypothetical protein
MPWFGIAQRVEPTTSSGCLGRPKDASSQERWFRVARDRAGATVGRDGSMSGADMSVDARSGPGVDASGATYGLVRPGVGDLREALFRIYGSRVDRVWAELLERAGMRDPETAPEGFGRLLEVMRQSEPVLAMCALSLQIRERSYAALTDRVSTRSSR